MRNFAIFTPDDITLIYKFMCEKSIDVERKYWHFAFFLKHSSQYHKMNERTKVNPQRNRTKANSQENKKKATPTTNGKKLKII